MPVPPEPDRKPRIRCDTAGTSIVMPRRTRPLAAANL